MKWPILFSSTPPILERVRNGEWSVKIPPGSRLADYSNNELNLQRSRH